jgi:acyl-CoA reductase-like NAD-dependent aldehyde dehydrogenase
VRAANRCAFGAFAYAGQICISVQRIHVHESVVGRFTELLLEEIKKVKVGDPALPETLVGPVIDSLAADRIMGWIDESVKQGARLLCGGQRRGNLIEPTLLTGTSPKDKINCEEVFGPVATLESYKDFDEALKAVNSSRFGLQTGLFTDSASLTQKAFRELDVGGLIVNEIPTFRADNMPYGGVKDSGLGREGLRFAMEDYCERKTMVRFIG